VRVAVDTLFAQNTHAALSVSRNETPLLPVCCLCRFMRDEISPSLDRIRWVTPRSYRKTHGVNPDDCLQTHTYCPGCLMQVMDTYRASQVLTTLITA
jgi:hypothetical protein